MVGREGSPPTHSSYTCTHMHSRIIWGSPRQALINSPVPALLRRVSSHTRRSLRTPWRSSCVCQPHRQWGVAADNRHAGGTKDPFCLLCLPTAQLFGPICFRTSVSEKSEKENPFKPTAEIFCRSSWELPGKMNQMWLWMAQTKWGF